MFTRKTTLFLNCKTIVPRLAALGISVLLLANLVQPSFGQQPAATYTQQMGFCRQLILQIAGIGRPAEETGRREAAFLKQAGLSATDAQVLHSAAMNLSSALSPLNQQASAITASGGPLSATDKQALDSINQAVQTAVTTAATDLLAALSADGVNRLSAIAAKQP